MDTNTALITTTAITTVVTVLKLWIDLYREARNRQWRLADREGQRRATELIQETVHGRADQLSDKMDKNAEMNAEFKDKLSRMERMFDDETITTLNEIKKTATDTHIAVRDELEPDVKTIRKQVDTIIGNHD